MDYFSEHEYIGVRVLPGEQCAVIGQRLSPSVHVPDGDVRKECCKCSHYEGGEGQDGACECESCEGEGECDHDMYVVELPGTCAFLATEDDIDERIEQAKLYGSGQIVILGSDYAEGHHLVPESHGVLMREPVVIAVISR